MAKNEEQKTIPGGPDKLAADNQYLKFLLRSFIQHHSSGGGSLSKELLESLILNAKGAIRFYPLELEGCPHLRTTWNIQCTAGTCQDCGSQLTNANYTLTPCKHASRSWDAGMSKLICNSCGKDLASLVVKGGVWGGSS